MKHSYFRYMICAGTMLALSASAFGQVMPGEDNQKVRIVGDNSGIGNVEIYDNFSKARYSTQKKHFSFTQKGQAEASVDLTTFIEQGIAYDRSGKPLLDPDRYRFPVYGNKEDRFAVRCIETFKAGVCDDSGRFVVPCNYDWARMEDSYVFGEIIIVENYRKWSAACSDGDGSLFGYDTEVAYMMDRDGNRILGPFEKYSESLNLAYITANDEITVYETSGVEFRKIADGISAEGFDGRFYAPSYGYLYDTAYRVSWSSGRTPLVKVGGVFDRENKGADEAYSKMGKSMRFFLHNFASKDGRPECRNMRNYLNQEVNTDLAVMLYTEPWGNMVFPGYVVTFRNSGLGYGVYPGISMNENGYQASVQEDGSLVIREARSGRKFILSPDRGEGTYSVVFR